LFAVMQIVRVVWMGWVFGGNGRYLLFKANW